MSSEDDSESPAEVIDAKIAELPDWQGEVLSRIRRLVEEAVRSLVRDAAALNES